MRPTDRQTLWCCRWGTMVALVWAQSEENAVLRVRHQRFNRKLGLYEVTQGPEFIKTEILVRPATEEDRKMFEEWGGEVPA